MKKKITMILTNAFDPDPRVYKEAVYLYGKGFDITVLCWHKDISKEYPYERMEDGIKVVRFPIPSVAGSGEKQIPAYLKYIMACKRYLANNPCDYLHCNDLDGAIAGYLARKNKTTMVFDMHEVYEDVMPKYKPISKLMRWLTIQMIKKSKAALYENDLYLKEPYKAVQERLFPLKNYPDENLIKPLPKTESEVFRIGYHGGVRGQIPEFTTLFEAVKGLDDVRVDVNGGGVDLEKLLELEKSYENVHIHGPFDGTKELTGLYANTDVVYAGYRPYCGTREYEEVVKFYECILTGTPIILTEAFTGMGSKINKYGFGITCDTLSVDAVRSAILKFKNDKSFWDECSSNERKYAPNYNWNSAVKVLDKVYT